MERRRPRFIVQPVDDRWTVRYDGQRSAFADRDLALRAAVKDAIAFHNEGLPSDVIYINEAGAEAIWTFERTADNNKGDNEVSTQSGTNKPL